MSDEYQWLVWVRRLRALAKCGLAFTQNVYDKERYHEILDITGDMAGHFSEHTPAMIADIFHAEQGYITPKFDVRGAVFCDDKILLVKEAVDGLWTLPGGWADINDSPSMAVEREIVEESGFQAKAIKIIALYDKFKHAHPRGFFHLYKCFFLCELTGGEAKASIETLDVGFFAQDEIPDLSQDRVLASQIETCFKHYYQQDLPTEFD